MEKDCFNLKLMFNLTLPTDNIPRKFCFDNFCLIENKKKYVEQLPQT